MWVGLELSMENAKLLRTCTRMSKRRAKLHPMFYMSPRQKGKLARLGEHEFEIQRRVKSGEMKSVEYTPVHQN